MFILIHPTVLTMLAFMNDNITIPVSVVNSHYTV